MCIYAKFNVDSGKTVGFPRSLCVQAIIDFLTGVL